MHWKAILFDLDGTLVETIDLYYKACAGAFKTIGIEMSNEMFRHLYCQGGHLRTWIEFVGGDPTSAEEVIAKRNALYINLLKNHTTFLRGAQDVLAVTKSTPRAIVTGSWRTYVDAIHEKVQIGDHFEHIVTVDDMLPFYKPHPHGFLLAADRLGVDPTECLVVGDQLFDIEAAIAGGMQSCLVNTSHTPEHARGTADHEVSDLEELTLMLASDLR